MYFIDILGRFVGLPMLYCDYHLCDIGSKSCISPPTVVRIGVDKPVIAFLSPLEYEVGKNGIVTNSIRTNPGWRDF